ncbi:fam-c protein [Plasmodium yoelii]|uniref:Fam-c protein n=3 Tax=Plasmodium yoelii TaxID=5861 RepID=A0AAF0B285_PLAYO|nr:fam-c protein [Plasmodium yoelii]EAA21681.1 hypothetical protein [Plasmodium yoelii yoelii]WBY54674.1 fam-c protein [Plasmodium yoelii yoelii]CDU16041.1 fam-c protein [Plasmodium yoelii]VTZ71665.1 fam-c protein [Plasmodium yoelii]|eukprot:XP_730116.1 fam-c protein [Plasmodium yoelii]
MNKKIFSLVCIALYAIFAVPIHCSEENVSDVGNKSVCGTKEINTNDENSDIGHKHENQLNNNNPKDDNDKTPQKKKKNKNKNKNKGGNNYGFYPTTSSSSTGDAFLAGFLRMRHRT